MQIPNEALTAIGAVVGYSLKYITDRGAVKQSEIASLRDTVLRFEDRLRIRDEEYIKMQAEIAKLTLQNEACEEKFSRLQGEYAQLKVEMDAMKRASENSSR